jgi:hypothetical protein
MISRLNPRHFHGPEHNLFWGCRFADVLSAAPFTAVEPSGWPTVATCWQRFSRCLAQPYRPFTPFMSLQVRRKPSGWIQLKSKTFCPTRPQVMDFFTHAAGTNSFTCCFL